MGFELLLPVVLFVLTLIIIFLLRSDDRRNQRTDLIRKRSQALLKTVEGSLSQFNESAQMVEERISKKIDESRLLMGHIDSQLTDLEARSEDLATLQKVLTTYQTALTQLEMATAQVEQRGLVVKGEIATLSRVQESLSDFDLRFEQFKQDIGEQITEGEENMRLQHLKVKELQSASFAKLQEYEKEVQQAEQDNLAQIAFHTETLINRQEASLALVSVQATKLRQLGEEGDQQMSQYEKALQASFTQANEKVQDHQRAFTQLQLKHAEQHKRQEEELRFIEESAVRHITEEMQSFVQHCYTDMAKIFEMTLNKTDISFQNMIRVVSEYLKELSLRLEQSRDVTKLLGVAEHTSLLSFKEELDALLRETLKGEQNLETLQALEEKASSSLALLHQEADQLHEGLASMKAEKLALLEKSKIEEIPRSVVFAMALVDEACKPLEKGLSAPEEDSSLIDDPVEQQEEKAEPPELSGPVEVEEMAEPIAEEELQETPVDEDLPSVVFAMALGQESEPEKVEAKKKPKHDKKKQDATSDKEKPEGYSDQEEHDAGEKRQVEYLTESEEEDIILDEDDGPSR